jgi:hypothetical protein
MHAVRAKPRRKWRRFDDVAKQDGHLLAFAFTNARGAGSPGLDAGSRQG